MIQPSANHAILTFQPTHSIPYIHQDAYSIILVTLVNWAIYSTSSPTNLLYGSTLCYFVSSEFHDTRPLAE
jgi:hypothetical protein